MTTEHLARPDAAPASMRQMLQAAIQGFYTYLRSRHSRKRMWSWYEADLGDRPEAGYRSQYFRERA